MDNENAKCPECNEILSVDETAKAEICKVCGKPFVVMDAIRYYDTTIGYLKGLKCYTVNGKAIIRNYLGSSFQRTFDIPRYINGYPVVGIDDKVFRNIRAEEFIFPEGMIGIGNDTFSECTKITKITFPESMRVIGDSAFEGCSSLSSITLNDGLSKIGRAAFAGCNIETLKIPDSVTEIENACFAACKSLSSVNIPEKVTRIHSGTFFDCKSLTTITIPDNVTRIGDSAFDGCKALVNIILPENLVELGFEVFKGCGHIAYTKYSNACYVGSKSNPFLVLVKAKNKKITSCDVHPDTKFISSHAFKNCTLLENITLPKTLLGIDATAFDGCDSLNNTILKEFPATNIFSKGAMRWGGKVLLYEYDKECFSLWDYIKNMQ